MATERESQLPTFRHPELWERALTHRSYGHEHPNWGDDNERLEFLGDAVLGFLVGKLLYERYPDRREGELSHLRAALVNNQHQLAELAVQLGLDRWVRLGKGAERQGSRRNPEILSDTFEAVVGAYYLDAGIEAVESFLQVLFLPLAERAARSTGPDINAKGRLQEWALAHAGELPHYAIVSEVGQDHAKQFAAEVRIAGERYGTGSGPSKKAAEKAAARAALEAVAGAGSASE